MLNAVGSAQAQQPAADQVEIHLLVGGAPAFLGLGAERTASARLRE